MKLEFESGTRQQRRKPKRSIESVSFRKTSDDHLIATKHYESTGGNWVDPDDFVMDGADEAATFLRKCFG